MEAKLTAEQVAEIFPKFVRRDISFQELLERPSLFNEVLRKANSDLCDEIEQIEKTVSASEKLRSSVSPGVEREKYDALISATRGKLQDLRKEAESEVLAFLDLQARVREGFENADELLLPSSDSELVSQSETENSISPSNAPSYVEQYLEKDPEEVLFRRIATQVLMFNVRDVVKISRRTGIPIVVVRETMSRADFQNYLGAAQDSMPALGLISSNGRVQELLKQYGEIEMIREERAICASRPEEISDEEMIRLGFSPQMRDLDMALQPGAKSGLLRKEAVVMRILGGDARGTRTQIVFNYSIDSQLQGMREKILNQIHSIQKDLSQVAKPVKKKYSLDLSKV